jgi:hypothetical protein
LFITPPEVQIEITKKEDSHCNSRESPKVKKKDPGCILRESPEVLIQRRTNGNLHSHRKLVQP